MKTDLVKDKSLLSPGGTDRLCENLVNTKFEDLSESHVEIFKDRLLDMAGCIFGGDIVPEDRFFYDYLKDMGGKEEAPIFADKGRLPLTSAVMHNCLHARANDYGNMFMTVHGDPIASHFGETLIPMGLTLADVHHTSGKDFITNNIAAEDTIGRVLYTLPVRWPVDMELVSSIASALAIRYYGFDAKQAKTALSYAAVNYTEPGNSYYDYCQEFKLHNAESARMGILSCEIAKGGWRGLEDPFFGHWGLLYNKVPEGEVPDLYEKTFEGLGKVYFTEGRFKKGPGGIPTTAAADLGKIIRAQIIERDGAFDADKISKIVVYQSSNMRKNYYYNPFSLRDHTNALFSYRFAFCCTLYHGERTISLVQTPEILKYPKLVELAENAEMDTFDCGSDAQIIKARVEMTDGHVYEQELDYRGSMKEYPTKEFLQAKFWEQFNAFGKLPKSVGEKIIEMSGRIEEVSDMREFTELLTIK